MKKVLASILSITLVAIMIISLASCNEKPVERVSYDIVVWTSEIEGVTDQVLTQVQRYVEKNHPEVDLGIVVEGMSEGEAATQMISSVEDGADIFFFAQDQLSRLVQAAALNPLGVKASETVTSSNDASAVRAATLGDKIYAYPATSDNGYFMFYDKSVVKAEHLGSLEDIIADCEAAGKMFSFNLEGSGWYNASFFFATGCVSNWTTDETGAFTSVNDTFNSAAGLVSLKAMQKLLQSTAYHDSANGADFAAAVPSAVVISGTWDSATVKNILGDNYGVAELPSFTVDGKTYHLGSFSGNKLVGVKPQTDAKRAAFLQEIAQYLTSSECQLERFNSFGWGPSNLEAQASEAVKSDVTLSALAAQNKYAVPQGMIHGSWWDISKSYAAAAKAAKTNKELQDALDAYKTAIDGLFSMPTDVKEAFTVIGKFDGHNWDADIKMTQKPSGTWYTDEPIAFKAGDEFQTRQGLSWDVQFGKVDPATGTSTKDNFVVEADGNYYVKLVYNKEAGTGVVSLEKVNPSTGWTLIGEINGTSWNQDFYMEPDASGVWKTTEAYEMKAGTQFKVRKGLSWDESFGDGTANFVVPADGTYHVQFDPETSIVSLV